MSHPPVGPSGQGNQPGSPFGGVPGPGGNPFPGAPGPTNAPGPMGPAQGSQTRSINLNDMPNAATINRIASGVAIAFLGLFLIALGFSAMSASSMASSFGVSLGFSGWKGFCILAAGLATTTSGISKIFIK